MRALFTSCVCDWCDGLVSPDFGARGWVLWPASGELGERQLYVFPSREMAEYYQHAIGSEDEPREVVCAETIHWVSGRGSIPKLTLADRLYTIFADHRFAPGPYRACLAPR